MKAVGYARVSSDKQLAHGVSLEAQMEKIRAMSKVQGSDLLEIVVDGGESARSLERPGMSRLLQLVREGVVQCVIVTKLDRLTRSVRDLAELVELFSRRNVALVSLAESLDTATAAGRLGLNMLVSVSQWEREAIGERTKCAMQFKKRNGERVGTVPYGFTVAADGKSLQPDPPEQKVIRRIKKWREEGRTLRQIASDLNQRQITTRKGSHWHFVYVANILKAA